MKKININFSVFFVGIAMLVIGLLIGWFVKPSGTGSSDHKMETTQAKGIWTCSMDPQIRQPEAGKCPICGMDLVLLDEGSDHNGEGLPEVRMSPTAMQLANVQTMIVGHGKPTREVRMTGKVQPDERLLFAQVTHLDGRVEQLNINFTGETVRKGQQIASIYSPELVTAQQELFSALKIKDLQPTLYHAAKQKLKNWKLTDAQIEEIINSGSPRESFPILADVSGIVLEKRVNLGDYVMRGMPLYDIVDLSKVWVLFDLYESDIPWAKVGSTVDFSIHSLPGEHFKGKIAFIDPVINSVTRVATARVEVPNSKGKLKPEMFATGIINTHLSIREDQIIVPQSAVMWTGERSVVYTKLHAENGIHFALREITLGPLTSDGYVVKEGLKVGEEIAINGTFSIDAAAQLAGKPSMMNLGGSSQNIGHHHDGSSNLTGSPEISLQTRQAVEHLFSFYFPLKDMLVVDDLGNTRKLAIQLKNAFEKTNGSLFTGKIHEFWMKNYAVAKEALGHMATTKDIEAARKHFKVLSDQMVVLAKTFGPFKETVYIQHCPMANENTGADWVSNEKPIRNPYFGDKMLTCGSVKEVINSSLNSNE